MIFQRKLFEPNINYEFMDLMKRFLKTYLDMFVIIFFYDILIYSRNKEDHVTNLKIVLHSLKDKELYAKFSKSEFCLMSGFFCAK